MANVRTPRTAWVDAALKALGSGGPDAIRIEVLAARLGVSKGGFYWHFKDRQALIDETLDGWEQAGTEDVITRIEGATGEARDKIRRLVSLSPNAEFEVELAVRDWARRDAAIAARIQRIDDRRMAFLRRLFGEFCADERDTIARSMLAYSLLVGAYFVAPRLGGEPRAKVLQISLDELLR